jgi:hypothetical protein
MSRAKNNKSQQAKNAKQQQKLPQVRASSTLHPGASRAQRLVDHQ